MDRKYIKKSYDCFCLMSIFDNSSEPLQDSLYFRKTPKRFCVEAIIRFIIEERWSLHKILHYVQNDIFLPIANIVS